MKIAPDSDVDGWLERFAARAVVGQGFRRSLLGVDLYDPGEEVAAHLLPCHEGGGEEEI